MTMTSTTTALAAVGAYVRALRKARGMTRAQLSEIVATSTMHLLRLEHGNTDVRSSLMSYVVRAVGGSLDDVGDLHLNPTASAEDGRRLAARRVERAAACAVTEVELVDGVYMLRVEDGRIQITYTPVLPHPIPLKTPEPAAADDQEDA